jgi:hypothetical protein
MITSWQTGSRERERERERERGLGKDTDPNDAPSVTHFFQLGPTF